MRDIDPNVREREAENSAQLRDMQAAQSGGSSLGMAIGIGLIILGIVAIARPAFAAIASTLVFGWLFIVAGVAQVIYAFFGRNVGQLVWKLLLGIIYLVAGATILSNVLAGVATITLILGVTTFAQGVLQVIFAFTMRPVPGWTFILGSGILSVILGILIWSEWPADSAWLLGVWVGLSLLSDGLWAIMLSASAEPQRL